MPSMADKTYPKGPGGKTTRTKVIGDGAVDPHCDDCCFAFLFILQAAGMISLCAMWLPEAISSTSDQAGAAVKLAELGAKSQDVDLTLLVQTALLSVGVALLLSLVWIKLWMETLERFAKCLIVTLNLLMPAVCLLVSGYFASAGMDEEDCDDYVCTSYIVAASLAVFALLQLLWLCCAWSRIELTAQILSDVCSVVTDAPGSILVAFLMVLVMVVWYGVCYGAIMQVYVFLDMYAEEQELSTTAHATYKFWLTALGVFFLFWGHETFRMISHVTTCGVVASWYFYPHVLTQGTPCCRPATCDSLRRALTSAFGSIAFGALILAFFDLLQYLVHKAFDAVEKAGDNAVVKCVRCCVEACMACIKKCLEWLTDYAFVYIAIYGISFVEAGIEVKDLVVSAGLDAIAQTTLLAPILFLGKILGGLLGGVAAVVVAHAYLGVEMATLYTHTAFAIGGVAAFVACTVGLTTLESGTKTLFVCYAEEPEVLKQRKPKLAEEMQLATKLKAGGDSLIAP